MSNIAHQQFCFPKLLSLLISCHLGRPLKGLVQIRLKDGRLFTEQVDMIR